ncbi:MAG: zinc ribbon domain-containing protein [Actinobacteria bacterium]|nr:zinc ribbon domain-containing protein [Actinomycetota bacterium]MBU1942907.1 zinc ribbon domain-containing protein [Actinomycetota bacterium]MBU2687639.1 zinc ribbon domain-containing protein [Actinomycetota bacterium]
MPAQTTSGMGPGIYIFVLLMACVFGVVAGKIVQNGGYPFWVGFLLGFFFGLFGVIFAFVLQTGGGRKKPPAPYPVEMYYPPPGYQEPRPQPPPAQAFAQGAVNCLHCGSAAPANEQFCWNCGGLLQAAPALWSGPPPDAAAQWSEAPPAAPAAPVVAMNKICPLCHSRNAGNAAFCAGCGTEISRGSAW